MRLRCFEHGRIPRRARLRRVVGIHDPASFAMTAVSGGGKSASTNARCGVTGGILANPGSEVNRIPRFGFQGIF